MHLSFADVLDKPMAEKYREHVLSKEKVLCGLLTHPIIN